MQTFTNYTAGAVARQIASQHKDRSSFVMQNKSSVAGEIIGISNNQQGPFLELDPREKFGRDVFAPTDEIWIIALAGTPTLLLIEEF